MSRWVTIFLLFLIGCKEDKLVKSPNLDCGQKCWLGDSSLAGIGSCTWGKWICDENGENMRCIDYGKPHDEECDGIDNDCDGKIDKYWSVACYATCGIGKSICSNGKWTECIGFREPTLEICDNIDNDCDGIIDNIEKSSIEFCYTGPIGSSFFGDCHPGTIKCESGIRVCRNEKLPLSEECDGIDNNCNGIIDDGLNNKNVDIVFTIDDSCSMDLVIDKIKESVRSFSKDYNNNNKYKFSLLRITDPINDGKVVKILDLSDAAIFSNSISMVSTYNSGGLEANWDAVWLTADFTNNLLNITWRSDSNRYFIMFTDEAGQTYLTPPITQSMAATQAKNAPMKSFIFSSINYWADFNVITTQSNGKIYDIYISQENMTGELRKILKEACE